MSASVPSALPSTRRHLLSHPLTLAVVLPLVVLLVAGLITQNAYQTVYQTALSSARQSLALQTDQVVHYTHSTLDDAELILDAIGRLVHRREPLSDAVLAEKLRGLLVGRPALTGVGFSLANGSYRGVARIDSQNLRFVRCVPDKGVDLYVISASGALIHERTVTVGAEHGHRSEATETTTWSRPYQLPVVDRPGFSASKRILIDGPDTWVDIRTDVCFHGLTTSLDRFLSAGNGLLVTEADGTILEAPAGMADLSSRAAAPITLANASHPTLMALQQAFGAQRPLPASTSLNLTVAGDMVLAATRSYDLAPGTSWRMILIAPLRTYLVSATAIWKRSLFITLGVLAGSILIAVLFFKNLLKRRLQLEQARDVAAAAQSKLSELGSYQLRTKLGSGGMGEVWLAEHQLLSRSAAIKLIQPSALSSADEDLRTLQQRFEREAQSMASLNSINTVRVYDYGLSADQRLYYVMEHLDGIDLDELVARHGPQPLGRTCAILRQLANSLAEAHDQGLIHRDMKPANAFLCRQADDLDIVKVLDFGMVRHVDDSNDKRLTMQNTVIGTPAFMSPEQAQGEPELTTDVDIYALGCIAFWLLTGKVLFDRKTPMEVLMAHVSDPVPDIETVADRELPLPLIELIHDCLEKHPARRPDARSVRQVVTDIEAACDDWSPCLRAEWWHDKKPLPAGGSDPQIILNCDSSAPVMTCRKQLSSNG